MKQMKFLLVALMTVLMGMSVTSCLKGDDNNTIQLSNFVRVNTYDYPISFKDAYGTKLIPTQNVSTTKPMALIAYQYDRCIRQLLTQRAKKWNEGYPPKRVRDRLK